jgi:hypothetical protein
MAGKLQINLQAGLSSENKAADPVASVPMDAVRIRYFDAETGAPLPQDVIEDRIRRTSVRMDRLTVEMAMDMFFLKTHYYDAKGWNRYMRERLAISRGYAYDVDKVLTLLSERYGNGSLADADDNLGRVEKTLIDVGIGRLKLVAQVRDGDQREKLLSALETGKNVRPAEILSANRQEPAKLKPESEIARLRSLNARMLFSLEALIGEFGGEFHRSDSAKKAIDEAEDIIEEARK